MKHDFAAEAGELVCERTGDIHQVRKKSDQVTLSLHTYGKHVDHSNRSPFDFQSQTTQRFLLSVEVS